MCILLSKYPLNKEENALNNNPTDFVYGKSQDNIYHKLHQVDVSPITNAFLSKPSPFLIPKAKESRAVLLSFPNQPTIPFDFTHKNAYKRASASVKPLILTKIPLPKTKYSDETAAQSFTVVGEFSGLLHSTDSNKTFRNIYYKLEDFILSMTSLTCLESSVAVPKFDPPFKFLVTKQNSEHNDEELTLGKLKENNSHISFDIKSEEEVSYDLDETTNNAINNLVAMMSLSCDGIMSEITKEEISPFGEGYFAHNKVIPKPKLNEDLFEEIVEDDLENEPDSLIKTIFINFTFGVFAAPYALGFLNPFQYSVTKLNLQCNIDALITENATNDYLDISFDIKSEGKVSYDLDETTNNAINNLVEMMQLSSDGIMIIPKPKLNEDLFEEIIEDDFENEPDSLLKMIFINFTFGMLLTQVVLLAFTSKGNTYTSTSATSSRENNHGDAIKELSDNIMKEFLSESLQLSDIRYGYFDMDKTVPTTQCVMDEADMDTDMPPEPNTLSKGISLMLSFGFLCFTSFVHYQNSDFEEHTPTFNDRVGIQEFVDQGISSMVNSHVNVMNESSENIMREFLPVGFQIDSDVTPSGHGYFEFDKIIPKYEYNSALFEVVEDKYYETDPISLLDNIRFQLTIGNYLLSELKEILIIMFQFTDEQLVKFFSFVIYIISILASIFVAYIIIVPASGSKLLV
ncbi:hypothetical protein DFJ63DRAFT_336235 [Scheffersomyces coipomensis]|uniref:uncharacterized protein n=1 Tax=Scheffersomyces coipomensis TaxID=1788519 RepID=UPI00315D9FAD